MTDTDLITRAKKQVQDMENHCAQRGIFPTSRGILPDLIAALEGPQQE
ncbi:MAG: hypothetical protein U5N55_04780 [Cypionkella sp.]|nr:hypothetical protein [Cypionkella sp.]